MSRQILFFLVVIGLCACAPVSPNMVYPGASWLKVSPTSEGVDENVMMEALRFLESKCFEDGLEEVMIIRNGRVIFHGDSVLKKHNIWSCTKSFTSTILGLMIADELVHLDDTVCHFEPLLCEKYPTATFRHFITMTSGYNAIGSSRWGEASEDWSLTPYAPTEPLFAPGTQYAYWDEAMMILGRTLTKILGKSMKSYFDEKIALEIGFGEWEWGAEGEVAECSINNGCTGIICNASQLARFGHLFLNRGQWDIKQLIPENWIAQATTVQVADSIPVASTDRQGVRGSGSYGFNWWLAGGLSPLPDAPVRTYYASGLNHNVCFVIPEWNMVIVRMGVDGNPTEGKHIVWNEFLGKLKKGVLL